MSRTPVLTQWVVYHVASGQSFFSGAICLLASVGLSPYAKEGWQRSIRNILVALGCILIVVSATPLPPGIYLVLLIASLLWIVGEMQRRFTSGRVILGLRVAVAIAWLMAVLLESPFHELPRVPPLNHPVLGIIGDSVTAGMGANEAITWPSIFAERHNVSVRDHSRAGATMTSALWQADTLHNDERLVLLEIGGNDLLGSTTAQGFEAGLEALLTDVCRPDRVVVMLELPLPPLFNGFGRVQRRLAQRHRVLLVPKRIMLGVLQQGGNTLDSIHLSQAGHGRMADAVWEVVRGAYEKESMANPMRSRRR